MHIAELNGEILLYLVTIPPWGRLAIESNEMNIESFQNHILPAKNKLYRFALRLLGSEEEAKDVVQEVFIRVWNGREQMNQVQNWEEIGRAHV